jgi:hypothetical protein
MYYRKGTKTQSFIEPPIEKFASMIYFNPFIYKHCVTFNCLLSVSSG